MSLNENMVVGAIIILFGLCCWGIAFEKAEKGGTSTEDVVRVAMIGSAVIAGGVAWWIMCVIIYGSARIMTIIVH